MHEALTIDRPASQNVHDSRFAALYELDGGITELFAKELISQSGLALSSHDPVVILDNACGTGAVSSVLHRTIGSDKKGNWQLTCGDMSDSMLYYTRQKMLQEEWHNTEVKIVNAQNTCLPSAHYTHVFTAFAFNLFPDDFSAMKGSRNASEYFNLVAFWQFPRGRAVVFPTEAIWVCTLTAAMASLPGSVPAPSEKEIDRLHNVGWDEESSVRAKFEQAGLSNIQVRTVKKEHLFPMDQFVESCTIIIPMIVNTFWTQDQRDQYESQLPLAIRRYAEGKFGKDGLASLEAEAIIATSRKP
ncbi:UbiE/COQ5 family methyltransferase [Aspergillus nomiae NRRL 13137]|uniref:UbiE/COQ5 family methyltransferase n=1 Tax=Aspergillus nomiae NRRL (strain ATCC 15546 / NRRL 13137 / CBS 260.88 / M93) TaxID=1509407 RepID=A0A0L1J647_ASPN3|nr:UbiE/COQ5 family methyltransferase [Aspergillus nomiae NRRL 13137]KNG87150.1 UbiE/COQ5 family methyltransferase [Aspergillus nomiae NRRL 13137]